MTKIGIELKSFSLISITNTHNRNKKDVIHIIYFNYNSKNLYLKTYLEL